MTFSTRRGGIRARRPVNATLVSSGDNASMMAMFQAGNQIAGKTVNSTTAMRVSAVYACVRLLAGAVAGLPVVLYRRGDRSTDRTEEPKSQLWRLLNQQPWPGWLAASMWEWLVACMLLRGDGFAQIHWQLSGGQWLIAGLQPLHPDWVRIEVRDNLLYYVINEPGQDVRVVDQASMLHLPGLGFDGTRSMSVISWGAANSVGTTLAADEHAARLMQAGGTGRYALETEKRFQKSQRDALRDEFDSVYSNGSFSRPLILTEGLSVKALSMNAVDAQLVESRRFNVEDIARAFGVPPHMVGAVDKTTSWGSGVEEMGRGFLIWTLAPHLTRWSQELNVKLIRDPRLFLEHRVDALAWADLKTRNDSFRQSIGGSQGPGWMTTNEIRRANNLPAVEGGDQLYNPVKSDGESAKPDGDEPLEENDE